ncbi:MAG: SLBB domain-containing protein [Chloroflexi bacterium]|nr:SLBB domain-containing protein [Chloroflexota bacterium]
MTPDELAAMAEREAAALRQSRWRVACCASTNCVAAGSLGVLDALRAAASAAGLADAMPVVPVGCLGLCSHGPLVRVEEADQPEALYQHVAPAIAAPIVACHHLGAPPPPAHRLPDDLPFFTRQVKIVLANVGRVDPERIEDAVATGGYRALSKVLTELTPEQVCAEIGRSGLRGRGGAGFPVGIKWGHVRTAIGERKYIVANGDEGDPGAYMDRTVMEDDPHRVLEGMIIAGYAVGASQGFVYVRGEYPVAVKRLERAIRQARRHGLLGAAILGSSFDFELEVRIGAGAFVCGEETALMASIEGRRGTPRVRPPFPAQAGLWGYPTLINNVETFANIAPIIDRGADWFAGIGTEKSRGTKVFALAGRLNNTGLIEVPMGITLRDIVEEIGGGITDGRPFKAAQTGGPSGGYIPLAHLDTPVDYESLRALGSIMGSGGLVVIDDRSCMPDLARFFMEFCADESCGKCVPCRVGTVYLLHLLDEITTGLATPATLDRLEYLCQTVRVGSLCGLGQSAPNPVLSTLRSFRDEYEAHIRDHYCPAGVCAFTAPAATPVGLVTAG